MGISSGNKLSYVKAVREVLPSVSLREFLATAHGMAEDVEVVPDVLDPLVYAAESLRVTIYERHAKAGRDVNELLRKVYARMESPTLANKRTVQLPYGGTQTTRKKQPNPLHMALNDVESLYRETDGPLLVRTNRIIATTRRDSRLGTELALLVDDGSVASVLDAQSNVLLDAEAQMIAGRKLRRLANEPIAPLAIPFMRAPLLDDYHRKEFVELLSADLPVHNLEIGRIEWKLNTVTGFEG